MVNGLRVENGRYSDKPGSLFLVIPDIFYRESILVSFRMDPRYQPAGKTTGMFLVWI